MDKPFLERIYGSEDYSDCSFIFPNEELKVIKGHRLVLADVSPKFRELFEDVQSQTNEGCVIEIKDVDSAVFNNFLRLVYCKNIDLPFEKLVELYEVCSKFNDEDGKSYLKEVFCKEEPMNSNVQGFIHLLEFASATDDQSLLKISAKKLLIDYDFEFKTMKVKTMKVKSMKLRPRLFDKAIRCLNDKTLKQQPMKLLSIISNNTFLNEYKLLDDGRIYNETLELFCWEKAKLSDILTSYILNDDQKIKFLIKNIEGNSTKSESETETQNLRQYIDEPGNQSKKYLESFEPGHQTLHYKMINDSAAKISSSYTTQTDTDCKFVFPNENTLKAHKYILSLASPVFKAMFYGDLKEGDSVKIVDVEEPVFDLFLKTIYLIDVNLAVESSRTICDLYAVLHKYECLEALNLIREDISTRPSSDAFLFYELSQLYDDKKIEQKCLITLKDPLCAMETNYFLDASPQTICTVYKCNTVKYVPGRNKKLVEKLEQYIEANKQANPEIKSQIQEAFKGIYFAELEIIDILKTSLLASIEKLTMVAVKLNNVNPQKALYAFVCSLDVSKFSWYDISIFNLTKKFFTKKSTVRL